MNAEKRNKIAFVGMIGLVGTVVIALFLLAVTRDGDKKAQPAPAKTTTSALDATKFPTPVRAAQQIGTYVNVLLETNGSRSRAIQVACKNVSEDQSRIVADSTTPYYGCLLLVRTGAVRECAVAVFSLYEGTKVITPPRKVALNLCTGG